MQEFPSATKNWLLKNTKNHHPSASGSTPVLVLKRMLGQKFPPLKNILKFQD